MLLRILLFSGLFLYLANYAAGWLLHFDRITMTKRAHQVLFGLIIVNLFVLLFFIGFLSKPFILCAASLLMLVILPFGEKGGMYHRTVATAGLVLYLGIFYL